MNLDWEWIENSELLVESGFEFHDCKPVHFEHEDHTANLMLYWNDQLAIFHFEAVSTIEINTDIRANWVNDYDCYEEHQSSHIIVFNVGDYTIRCRRIILEELLQFQKYKSPNEDAFWVDSKGKKWSRPAIYKEGSKYAGKETYRQKKAKEQGKKKSVPVEVIINLTNKLLLSAGVQAVKDNQSIVKGEHLRALVKATDSNYEIQQKSYKDFKSSRSVPMDSILIWMKFTTSGHVGVVARGDDINFSEENSSSQLIKTCGLEWDKTFVLIFPLVPISGRRPVTMEEASQIEIAVGNYLIDNGVPIIDYFSHNYQGVTN